MKRWTLWSTFCLAAVAAHAQTQMRTPPRTLAFIVGVEHYQEDILDKLQYAADDARELEKELKAVTDLDPQSVLLQADHDAKTFVTDAEIRTKYQLFVQNIKSGMNVIVYLGGHGTKSGLGGLRFLPSNFDRKTQTGDIDFDEFKLRVQDVIARKSLTGVSVTFLLNTCASGNALIKPGGMADVDDQQIADDLKDMFLKYQFGKGKYALIPATAKDRDTFEDQNRHASDYAFYLVEGLAGLASKDGVVTSGSLYDYLSKNLPEPLPWNPELDRNIVLAVTRQPEGEAQFMLGSALLAANEALVGNSESEIVNHEYALLELARAAFDRVAPRAPDLALRAALRRAQIDAINNRRLSERLMPADAPPDSPDAQQLARLLDPDNGESAKVTLPLVRAELAAGAPFYALIVEGTPTSSPTPGSTSTTWRKALEGLPGHKKIEQVVFRVFGSSPDFLRPSKVIESWIAELDAQSPPPRLILAYTGTVRYAQDGTPGPMGPKEVGAITSQWPGPVVYMHLASGGNRFVRSPAPRKNISLFLAAQEMDTSPAPGVPAALAKAFVDGVSDFDTYQPVLELIRKARARAFGSKSGTPAWIPIWGAPTARSTAIAQLEPFRRFALHLAVGCRRDPLAACDERMLLKLASDPFDVLGAAAAADLDADADKAAAAYTNAANMFQLAAKNAASLDDKDPHLQKLIEEETRPVRLRARVGETKVRNVVIVRVGVSEYASPLIADLPDPKPDLDAYRDAVVQMLKGASAPEIIDLMPKKAADVTAALEALRARLKPDDLIIFIYSGRGFEYQGRRFLTTAGTAECGDEPSAPASCVDDWSEVIDLWTIAKAVEGRWLLAIYDTQFQRPHLDQADEDDGHHEVVLDKNLHSVRPLPPETEASNPSKERTTPVLLGRRALPPHQVHVWADGTVTAGSELASTCAGTNKNLVSSLAAVLPAALAATKRDTYSTWIRSAAELPCMTKGEIRRIVAQGDIGVAVFATGEAADLIQFFHTTEARRSMNLRAADLVAARIEHQFPGVENQISRAALLLAISMFHDFANKPLPEIERRRLLDEALRLLNNAQVPVDSPLAALRLELVARADIVAGNPAQARAELREQPSLLTQRDLARTLVTVTEDMVAQQPLRLLQETSEALNASGADSGTSESIDTARRHLRELLDEERKYSNAYYVEPPP